MRKVAALIWLSGVLVAPAFGATHTAASAALADVQAKVDLANHGDTVEVPAGSATWSSSLTFNKAITMKAMGTVTWTAGATLPNGFIYTSSLSNTNLYRITGFTFDSVNQAAGSHQILILGTIDLPNVRIDRNTFHHGDIGIEIGGCKGVIDANYFYNGNQEILFTAGSTAQANASWDSMAAGTGDALFIEGNQFLANASYLGAGAQERIGTYNGGKLVIRYNTFNFTGYPNATTIDPIQTHGSAAGGVANGYWQLGTGGRRGQSVVEIYNNTVSGPRVDFFCILRGSANLVYNNTLDSAAVNPPRILLYEEEWFEVQWNPLRVAWPAEDQVHNSHFWNNTLRSGGTPNADYVDPGTSEAVFIQEGRDYFMAAPAASGGSETFTGANGASGSAPTDGVNDDDDYPTLGTMVYTAGVANYYFGYAAYTYPHPLVTALDAQPNGARIIYGGTLGSGTYR